MSSIQDQFFSYVNKLDKDLDKYPSLIKLENRVGVRKAYGAVGFVVVYFLMIFLNFGGIGQLFANVAGFIIPGYYSLLALVTESKADDTQLLTYWVVFAFFSVIEFWTKAILYWFPFYYFFKTIFLLYIGLPHFGGAQLVFHNFLKPVAAKIRASRSSNASSASENLKEKINEAVEAKARSSGVEHQKLT
ncbi:hypothetical protein NADFUDRAFT_33525 [Nadsonia fulvescens var. elongata DSM 6958]|uniref:Protein YOP1 n=1 Tax=Nadsonia fulvescens var. elongata DSM 6958 TaxID=857566 RepID=A0A1E3PNG6_9ASCO|nr:hypothetical protein NADFUDRAFT_33525 [Nadsonia fulvescens var. elongata DSM 6958]